MTWQPGQSGNPAGRERGSKNKKTLLREELEKDGGALAAAIKAKALEGDMTAAGLWLARLEPVLRSRGTTVQIELDETAPLSAQCEQVIRSIADGSVSVEEGKAIVDVLRQVSEVRALENGGSEAEALVRAFREVSKTLEGPHMHLPYVPPNGG